MAYTRKQLQISSAKNGDHFCPDLRKRNASQFPTVNGLWFCDLPEHTEILPVLLKDKSDHLPDK